MSERKMQPFSFFDTRRLLFCIAIFSVFLLFFSFFLLLKSSNSNSLVPDSVLMPVLPDNTFVPDTRIVDTSSASVPKSSEGVRGNSDTRIKPSVVDSSYASVPKSSEGVRGNSDTRIKPSVVDTSSASVPKSSDGVRGNSDRSNDKGKTASCDIDHAKLKVYMYDLPSEFHFGLLDWTGKKKDQIWPDVGSSDQIPSYPGGLNIQHSVEYWLTLDLLSSNVQSVPRPCTAIRVDDSSQADLFFVPFFSSVSYNRHSKLHGKGRVSRNSFLQAELVKFLTKRDEWKRSGGKDHLILAHHPNSMLDARWKLGSAMFLLADFGRYPVEIANLKKDIVAPYVHVVHSVGNDSAPFEDRPTLVYFQGAIVRKDGGMIRQELYQLLRNEKDVHFTFGSARGGGIRQAAQGMASSKFCLNIAGDTPSSNRLFDAIVSHCIPVIISDEIELPFEDVLDYAEFSIFVRASDAVKKGFLLELLRGIDRDEWTRMRKRLQQIAHHFEYQYPSQVDDAVDMIWQAVARKLSPFQLKLNKEKRYLHNHR